MSNNTIRINTTPNGADRFVKVKLDQEFDFIEILSLKISQTDAYRNFCADYGVVAGRVIVNNAFGVPNAKVSIFIPIDDIDSSNPEILGLYPYEIVSDKNSDGIRYNLLPTTSDSANPCFTPIGTFPAKREILDNPVVMEIYNKYYKFTTTTNFAGDYMIFGVPIGNYIIHVDADISDIGIISQRPYDAISQGASPKLFDSSTKYKGGANLDKLVQVKTANAAVNIEPFWGNSDNCEIGINRVDLDLNYTVIPSAIFMGNIFGDTDKNSVNKNCIPRRNLGALCDQSTGEGTIEMIRETVDGKIERFDIEGGNLIDVNGSWAYQIPMNLDYVVTDENGSLVPSDDPNKGLPTRANVRFRIGMDQTGGEGRLRTRAKHLVPHNPNIGKPDEIDYEFSEKTKKSSLRSLHWNKIYTASSFISRYQQQHRISGGLATRSTTGIKNVDGCGDKTPFPFNRVNTTFSPIFFIICLIIKVLGAMIFVVNYIFIPFVNLLIDLVNSIIGVLCDIHNVRILRTHPFGFVPCFDKIDNVACIFVRCPFETPNQYFAPGCDGGSAGYRRLVEQGNKPQHYHNDEDGHKGFFDLAGLDDCVAFEMARVLGLFEFDFYNDWINGSLYAFLLKYKRRRKGREKFCEYDCGDIASGGVDGDGNGSPDNDCRRNFLVDSCFRTSDSTDSQKELKQVSVREGVVKKYKNELYYAASTHNASDKLFSTEIINLGAVFDCDWQTVPKLQQYLVPTTYNIPPVIEETDPDNAAVVLATGQCGIGGNTLGLFFTINCLGLHVNNIQCLNIRHLCEFGVELDEYRGVIPTGTPPDGRIGKTDLDLDDADRPKWFRDIFTGLNFTGSTWDLRGLPYTTNFNNHDLGDYNFASSGTPELINGVTDGSINGDKYIAFRGYPLDDDHSVKQPKHSYYFYFGLLPGRTALDKMNKAFFSPCPVKPAALFDVDVVTTSPNFIDPKSGTAKITFLNGTGPYSGTVSGPAGYTLKFVTGLNNTPPIYTVTGLTQSTYTISGNDSKGNVVTESFVISPPPSIYGDALVTANSTNDQIPNGKIQITSIGGGSSDSKGTYTYTLYSSKNLIISGGTFTNVPLDIVNLSADTGPNYTVGAPTGHGYTLKLSDSAGSSIYINNLVLQGATPIIVKVLPPLDIKCFGQLGTINLDVQGGKGPYNIEARGEKSGRVFNGVVMNNVPADKYTITVEDSFHTVSIISHELKSVGKQMVILPVSEEELQQQCRADVYIVGVTLSGDMKNGDKFTILFSGQDSEDPTIERVYTKEFEKTFISFDTKIYLTIPKGDVVDGVFLKLTDAKKECFSPVLNIEILEIELPPVTLAINETGIDNTQQQCTPNQVSFKFNISHLEKTYPDFEPRKPYTALCTVTGINASGSKKNTQIPVTITQNQELIKLPVFTNNNGLAISCKIEVILRDSTGCETASTPISPQKTITLPTATLDCVWNKTTIVIGGQPKTEYTFNVVANTGIPTYVGSPTAIGGKVTSVGIPSTVKDKVGCTSTKSSGS